MLYVLRLQSVRHQGFGHRLQRKSDSERYRCKIMLVYTSAQGIKLGKTAVVVALSRTF